LNNLLAAQQYVTRWLLNYDDEYFALLYHDIDDLAPSTATEVFQHGRSVSIYGVKGIGKTTLMHGILWYGLQNSQGQKFLPVIVSVTGANSVQNLAELEDKFYRAVLLGLILSNTVNERWKQAKEHLSKFTPWVVSTAVSAVGLVFPPAALASDVAKEGTKKLLEKLGIAEAEKLLASRDIDPKIACDFIIKELGDKEVHPVFVIDELDKVLNESLLSDFFNGHQGWFQGKRTIISLSYTFGMSFKDATITSVKRFSELKRVNGVTTLEQFKSIMGKRLLLGISQINSNEKEAREIAEKIFAGEAYEKILNNYVPILHLMLEAAYRSLHRAVKGNSTQVLLSDTVEESDNVISTPTKIESLILNKLSESNKSPADLANDLSRDTPTISRSLKSMLIKDWIGKMGGGKNVQYFIKQKGEAARHMS